MSCKHKIIASSMISDVEKFYTGKTIFITGVTGFLGHVLLSKLLCSCPELRCIYILIREKKEKNIYRRVNEIFENPIFERAKQSSPDYEIKVKPIKGDCMLNNLGISDDDKKIIEDEVDIIFHVAATVKFDAILRESAYINVRSTDNLLDIARNMKQLKAFTYVSTAFSSCAERELIEEKFYDPPIKAHSLLMLVEQLDDEILYKITPTLIKPHSNTYIYTKIIAENLCRDKGQGLPISIFRPAAVVPCYEEPVLGWINNTYGPVGIVASYALGILKVVHADENCRADIVPGDFAINALIVSTHHTNKQWEKSIAEKVQFDVPIFNYSSSTTNFNLTWCEFLNKCDKALEKYPFGNFVTIPTVKVVKHYLLYRFLITIFHVTPAFIIDRVLIIFGKTPRIGNIYQKIHKLLNLIAYFSTKEWTIPNNNIDKLWKSLPERDKKVFYFNLDDLNIDKYFEVFIRGLRLYIAKDKECTVDKAIKRYKMYLILHYFVVATIILMFVYLLMEFICQRSGFQGLGKSYFHLICNEQHHTSI